MPKDPVCGMEVDEKKAGSHTTYKEQTYYFCSKWCKKAFIEVPEKYVGDVEYAPATIP